MMCRITSQLYLISIFSLILTGCAGYPVHTRPEVGMPCETNDEQLMGKSKEYVIEKFGQPHFRFRGPESEYFIYEGYGLVDIVWDIFLPFTVLPGGIYDYPEVLYCVLLEFDKNSRIIRYDSDWDWPSHMRTTCAPVLFNKKTATKVKNHLQKHASQGDANSILVLAKFFELNRVELELYRERLRINAEDGNVNSAYTLAVVFNDLTILKSLAINNPAAQERLKELMAPKYQYEDGSVAHALQKKTATSTASQQKDIVEKRNANNIERERKLKALINELEPVLCERAISGESKAQFELYMLGDKTDSKWLCRSADQGYTKAEMWLGYVLETGVYGFPIDNIRSYVWYRRAAIGEHQREIDDLVNQIKEKWPKPFFCKGTSCDIAQKIVDLEGKLGAEGIYKAESFLNQWKPGQCEREYVEYTSKSGS
jgi:TPR repeat protein